MWYSMRQTFVSTPGIKKRKSIRVTEFASIDGFIGTYQRTGNGRIKDFSESAQPCFQVTLFP